MTRPVLALTTVLLLALTALPAAAAEPTVVDDGCGDAGLHGTVGGEPVQPGDPYSPRADVDTLTVLPSQDGVEVTMLLCGEVTMATDGLTRYTTTWSVPHPTWTCTAELSLHTERGAVYMPEIVRHRPRGSFTVSCREVLGETGPITQVRLHAFADVDIPLGEGVEIDGQAVRWSMTEATVGADGMAFVAPGTVLSDVEGRTWSPGPNGSAGVNTEPPTDIHLTFGNLEDHTEPVDVVIPDEDDETA